MRPVAVAVVALLATGTFLIPQTQPSTQPPPADPVAKLAAKLKSGEATLEYKDRWGYLQSLLTQLDINTDSQVLVFSKTSLQQEHISPKTPRALFFNDTVSVGSVQGGALFEITVADADKGVRFYTLDTKRAEHPSIETEGGLCMLCHNYTHAAQTFVSNVYPSEDGTPAFLGGDLFHVTDHTTPFDERWGGWYVSGNTGKMKHLGNAVAHNPYRPVELETTGTLNLTSLKSKFDVTPYLTPNSDVVALLTLEHQTRAMYLMAAATDQFRLATSKNLLNKAAVESQLQVAVDNLVFYLSFAGEVPLPSPVKGVSTFTTTFPERGPRDTKGRTLRDFDLKTRVFRYPLSFTVYTNVFDEMNPMARDRVLRGLYDALSKRAGGRDAIEILRDTKPGLPDYWK